MPKIWILKDRLYQQQQRLLEPLKTLAETASDDVDLEAQKETTTKQKFAIPLLTNLKLESDNDRSEPELDDEPLSLVVKKGKSEVVLQDYIKAVLLLLLAMRCRLATWLERAGC